VRPVFLAYGESWQGKGRQRPLKAADSLHSNHFSSSYNYSYTTPSSPSSHSP
jgi:hypothetical protein